MQTEFIETDAGIFVASAAGAQSVSYQGKNIRMIIPSGAGGGYDTYARALAAHIDKYIPGKPTIVNQNMPGASGMIATNWAASDAAPKDGSRRQGTCALSAQRRA